MTTDPGRRPEPQLGRKRDPSRSDAILNATRELLLERGFDRFTVQDVATRSGSGVGAIYRRWENKETLVAEAIRAGGELAHQDSPNPQADLVDLVTARAQLANVAPDFVPGIVSAMRASPEVNDAMQHVHTTTAYSDVLARLLGDDHPHLPLLAEIIPAVIVHRSIFGGELDPETFSDDILALVEDLTPTEMR